MSIPKWRYLEKLYGRGCFRQIQAKGGPSEAKWHVPMVSSHSRVWILPRRQQSTLRRTLHLSRFVSPYCRAFWPGLLERYPRGRRAAQRSRPRDDFCHGRVPDRRGPVDWPSPSQSARRLRRVQPFHDPAEIRWHGRAGQSGSDRLAGVFPDPSRPEQRWLRDRKL